ncbi:hypothetical protein KR018_009406 [Drosophila ironensis]|nr:hypothetical protein KR018_009406 [Drosophila ironensis]
MVSFGCVAKLLSGLEGSASMWVKTVNPSWYLARELPKTILCEKVTHRAQQASTRIVRLPPRTAGAPKTQTDTHPLYPLKM